jgi:protein disulfide-isomerase A6
MKNYRFYAPWCGHCQRLAPAYEKAARSLAGLATVAAVDCDADANRAFCGSMGVQGFPTLKIVSPRVVSPPSSKNSTSTNDDAANATTKKDKEGKRKPPRVDDYQGARTAKAITAAVLARMPNHVRRLAGAADAAAWLRERNATAKAVLFSRRRAPAPLLKALAIDFLGAVHFAHVRDTDAAAVAPALGFSSGGGDTDGGINFPTLLLLPGGAKPAVVYKGEMDKEPLVAFLAQAAAPNPGPGVAKAGKKADKKAKQQPKQQKEKEKEKQQQKEAKKEKEEKKKTKTAKAQGDEKQKVLKQQEDEERDKQAFEQASAAHKSAEASESAASATAVTLEDQGPPTESPLPVPEDHDNPYDKADKADKADDDDDGENTSSNSGGAKPQQVPITPPPPSLPRLESYDELRQACLHPRASTCVLVLLPPERRKVVDGDADLPEGVDAATFNMLSDMLNALPDAAATALAEIAQRYAQRRKPLFPIYAVPSSNTGGASLRKSLLDDAPSPSSSVIAINARRGWWRRFDSDDDATPPSVAAVDTWVDAIRLGDGKKERLPDGLVKEEDDAGEPESSSSSSSTGTTAATATAPPAKDDADDGAEGTSAASATPVANDNDDNNEKDHDEL